jgi:hypothetical protein
MSTRDLAQPVTLPASSNEDGYAPGQFPFNADTAPDAQTAEQIRAHLRRTFNREGLLSAKEAA